MSKLTSSVFRSGERVLQRLGLRTRARRTGHLLIDTALGVLLRAKLTFLPARHDRSSPQRGLRILMVDNLLPDPMFGAGYPRSYAIIQGLVGAGCDVEYYPLKSKQDDLDRMRSAFGDAVRFHRGKGTHGLRQLLWTRGDDFDALFVSRPLPMTALFRSAWHPVRAGSIPVIYDAEAVLSPREKYRRELFGNPWSERKYRSVLTDELKLAGRARAITAVGKAEADLIRSQVSAPVFVLPHMVSVRRDAPGPENRTDLLFVGRLTGKVTASPNVNSVFWFITEVMSRLDALIGTDYRLDVVGLVEAPEIAAMASDRVVFHGVVKDLQPFYTRRRLFVAPTRFAAGIPLKVVEAMGEGIPCVVTPLLAGQLAIDAAVSAIGADADGFARECARLYEDDQAWLSAQAAGFTHVDQAFSASTFDHEVAEVVGYVKDQVAASG